MSFNIRDNEELIALMNELIGQSPHGYIELYGSGSLELLKTKPVPKEDDLIISTKDKLLCTIFNNMENINVNLSGKQEVNTMDFNLKNIAEQESETSKLEQPILSTWYKDFEEEFMYHKPTNIIIMKGWENSTSYWIQCRIGTLQPFYIYLPKLYSIDETYSKYDAFFTVGKNEIQYIHQYLYSGNKRFLSFYQIFWNLVNSKQKIIVRKLERNTEILKLNVIDECLREAMKLCCTYTNMDLSYYSLWLMSRQFKVQLVNVGYGDEQYREISGYWYDKVTGSFGNVGSKYSLKHGCDIKLINGHYVPVDSEIIEPPYSTERMINIFPSKAGFKRINVTCIEKSPLALTHQDKIGNPFNRYQDTVPLYMKEINYSKIPPNEEINLTCIILNIKDDIGSLRNNTLDMFNMHTSAMQKLMTADREEILIGNKLILPFREKAVIGGTYGNEEITQIECTLLVETKYVKNIIQHFEEQDIQWYSNGASKGMSIIKFVPDLIMNHTNRDNNIALRLLSNIRYESILENKTIEISLDESNKTILKRNDETIVNVTIGINGKIIKQLDTQLLFLTGYHQPTHSVQRTATFGRVNINYRQALAARQVFTPIDFNYIIKNFDKELYKAKLACGGYEIIATDDIKIHHKSESETMLDSIHDL
jgi:hypothetical protein